MILAARLYTYAQADQTVLGIWESFRQHVYASDRLRFLFVVVTTALLVSAMVRTEHIKNYFVPFIGIGVIWYSWAIYNTIARKRQPLIPGVTETSNLIDMFRGGNFFWGVLGLVAAIVVFSRSKRDRQLKPYTRLLAAAATFGGVTLVVLMFRLLWAYARAGIAA